MRKLVALLAIALGVGGIAPAANAVVFNSVTYGLTATLTGPLGLSIAGMTSGTVTIRFPGKVGPSHTAFIGGTGFVKLTGSAMVATLDTVTGMATFSGMGVAGTLASNGAATITLMLPGTGMLHCTGVTCTAVGLTQTSVFNLNGITLTLMGQLGNTMSTLNTGYVTLTGTAMVGGLPQITKASVIVKEVSRSGGITTPITTPVLSVGGLALLVGGLAGASVWKLRRRRS